MTVSRSLWRLASACLLPVLALVFSAGCNSKGGSSSKGATSFHVTGVVSYLRPPLLKDASGIPTGLETDEAKFQKHLGRGLVVRLWEQVEEKLPDGTPQTVYTLVNSTITSQLGFYSLAVESGHSYYVEVLSQSAGAGGTLRLVADVIDSSIPAADRNIYMLRKGLDGSSASLHPATAAHEATLNFEIGMSDVWLLGPQTSSPSPVATPESVGTGSRVIAALDSAYTFATLFGTSVTSGNLDIHYLRGINHPKGSFIEFDSSVYPLAYDGSTHAYHTFATLRGDQSTNDDAFDEGILFPMYAHSFLVNNGANLKPVGSPLPDLAPDLALQEAFADAMAANLLQSPYLADTAAAGTTYRDVRDLLGLSGSAMTPFSAPSLRALAWEIILKSNSLPTPGVVTDWDKIDPRVALRFLTLKIPTDTTTSHPTDVVNIYSQVARLQEAKSGLETVDLASIFTNSTLTPLLGAFNLQWPRPTAPSPYAGFLQDWGTDPTNASPTTTPPTQSFTMAHATMVDGIYPNVSSGEVIYAKYLLTKDSAFNLSLSLPSPLPSGASIEVKVFGSTYLFDAANTPVRVTMGGNASTPVLYTLRMRLISPNTLQPAPIQVALRMDPAP